MTYENNGKTYEVDSIVYGGTIINVNGNSITDDYPYFWVFFEGEELIFDTFEKAYQFAVAN